MVFLWLLINLGGVTLGHVITRLFEKKKEEEDEVSLPSFWLYSILILGTSHVKTRHEINQIKWRNFIN